jgi:electron transfer flavoprotein alpha subunit
MQKQENLVLAENLAAALGGVVCGSRFATDQHWLPLSRRVGKSGLSVKPKLYVALGVSGSPEHVEGMRKSECIIAVNSDPHAPIFNIAHYGVVEDAMRLLPVLTEAIEAQKSQVSP